MADIFTRLFRCRSPATRNDPFGFHAGGPGAFLERLHEAELEVRHLAGYKRFPPELGEFSDWHDEQVWPE